MDTKYENKQVTAIKKAVDILNEVNLSSLSAELLSHARVFIPSKEEFYGDETLTIDEAICLLWDYQIYPLDLKREGTMPDWISNENYNMSNLKASEVIELFNKVMEEAKKEIGELSEFRVCKLVITREENPDGNLVFFIARKKE